MVPKGVDVNETGLAAMDRKVAEPGTETLAVAMGARLRKTEWLATVMGEDTAATGHTAVAPGYLRQRSESYGK